MVIFKKLRTYYWLFQEFFKRHHKIIFLTTLTTLALTLIIPLFLHYLPTPKPKTRIARVGKFTPASLPQDIQTKLSLGLVSIDADGQIKPGLAQSWQISEDGKTYTFTLKKLTWHDGSLLKPQDIHYPFQEVVTEYQGQNLIFKLKEPFAPFLSLLSKPLLKNNRYGVGDYRLTHLKISKGIIQRLTLTSNQQKLIYKFYPTENTAVTAFNLGEVDRLENLSYLPPSLTQENRLSIHQTTNYQKITALFFNNKDQLLANKSIRQALAYALPDKSFGYERAISPISKKSWAFNPNVKKYDYNLQHAQKLFQENIKDATSVKLQLKTMLHYLDIAESIAKAWQEAFGIKVEVKVATNFFDDFQIALVDFTPPLDPDQYAAWHSTQSTNFTHYQNLKIDKLLEDGRKTLDPKLRKQIYQDFQRFLLEDLPAIFLFYPKEYSIQRPPLKFML